MCTCPALEAFPESASARWKEWLLALKMRIGEMKTTMTMKTIVMKIVTRAGTQTNRFFYFFLFFLFLGFSGFLKKDCLQAFFFAKPLKVFCIRNVSHNLPVMHRN